jgi:hypothetical protein
VPHIFPALANLGLGPEATDPTIDGLVVLESAITISSSEGRFRELCLLTDLDVDGVRT